MKQKTNLDLTTYLAIIIFLIAINTLAGTSEHFNSGHDGNAPEIINEPIIKHRSSRVIELENRIQQLRLQGDIQKAHEVQTDLNKETGAITDYGTNDPAFQFELNNFQDPPYENDFNVSAINSINVRSNATATVPQGAPNANRIWVASTQYVSNGTDTIKFYYSSNAGSSWVYYGKLYSTVNNNYRADELDIEVVFSGTTVFLFGVAGYHDVALNKPKCLFFRINTSNGSALAFPLNDNIYPTGDTYLNPRITSDNTVYTSSTRIMISFGVRRTHQAGMAYLPGYLYVDMIFSTIIQLNYGYFPYNAGFIGQLPSNLQIYTDIGYFRQGGADRVIYLNHINYPLYDTIEIVGTNGGYGTLNLLTRINEAGSNYGQRIAFDGSGSSATGVITYIRRKSGNDWDVYCLRTPDAVVWLAQYINNSVNRARSCDIIAVRGTTLFKVAYIQDNPTSPAAFYTGNSGFNWNSPAATIVSNQGIDTTYAKVRAGYTSASNDNCLIIWSNAGSNMTYGSRLCQSTTGILQNHELPDDYSLSQNYPNPFNPVTNIKFSIPDAGFITLKIYDISGRETVTLVNQNLNAGIYTVDFDASHLSSGAYFYRLNTERFTDVKKMILVK